MNMTQQTQANVMAANAMSTSLQSTQATSANEVAVYPKLQNDLDSLNPKASEMDPLHQDDQVAQFIKEAEEIRKAKAEKRLNARLKKMEVKQKAILLAEAQRSLAEARRKCESQPQIPYDYTPGPPSTIEDIFCAEKAREELIALEREQKEELLRQVMEKGAKERGEQWPPAEEMPDKLRFDHIPIPWPGEKKVMAKAFPGAATVKAKEPNE